MWFELGFTAFCTAWVICTIAFFRNVPKDRRKYRLLRRNRFTPKLSPILENEESV